LLTLFTLRARVSGVTFVTLRSDWPLRAGAIERVDDTISVKVFIGDVAHAVAIQVPAVEAV
jgi:hypothetical protein